MSLQSKKKIEAKAAAIIKEHPPDEHIENRPAKSMTFNATPDLRYNEHAWVLTPHNLNDIVNLEKGSDDASRNGTNQQGLPENNKQLDKVNFFSPRIDDISNLLADGTQNFGDNPSEVNKYSDNFETKQLESSSGNMPKTRQIPRNLPHGYEPTSLRESFEGLNQIFQNSNSVQVSQVGNNELLANFNQGGGVRLFNSTEGALLSGKHNIINSKFDQVQNKDRDQIQLLADTLNLPLSSQSPPNSYINQPSHSKISLIQLPNSVSTTQPRQPQNSRTGIIMSSGSGSNQPINKNISSSQPTKLPSVRPQVGMSLHIHRLSLSLEYLNYQKKKIFGMLSVSVIGGILQIINRGTMESNNTFIIFSVLSVFLQILCLIPIILRLQQISASSLSSQSTLGCLISLIAVQLFRTLVFTSNFLSDKKQVSSIEAVFELYLIMQLSHQTFRAFPIFRGKEKISLFYSVIVVAATISLLIDRHTEIHSIEMTLCIIIFSFVLTRLFLFHELPFTICKLYNAHHEQYSEMKKSYFSFMASDSSQFGSAGPSPPILVNKNESSNEKPHDSNELWRLRNRKDPSKGEADELESKYDAKKMLSQTAVFVFLNSKLSPTYFSPKMKQEIGSLFLPKETPKTTLIAGNYKNSNHIKNPNLEKNITASNLNKSQHLNNKIDQQNSSLRDLPNQINNRNDNQIVNPSEIHLEQNNNPKSQVQPQTLPLQSNQNNAQGYFQVLMDNIVLERVDNQTLHCWESLKKNTQNLQQDKLAQATYNQFRFPTSIPNLGDFSPGLTGGIPRYLPQQQQQEPAQLTSTFSNQPLHLSQFNLTQQNLTYKDLITARNSFLLAPKASASGLTQNNIGYSSRIGLKSKNLMVSLKDFLEKVSNNPGVFGKFGIGKPITIASFSLQGETENKFQLQKYQIKIYPQWSHSDIEVGGPNSLNNSVQSMVTLTTSKKYNLQENEHEHDTSSERPLQFLIVFEEVKQREEIVAKTQFYKFLKSIFRCFNNDLSRSLANILGTSQAGALNKNVEEKFKEQFIRPILLSCKIIKYILHNLRDFNDIVGERFHLQVRETSIPKMAEDSVMLFKATSDKKISFKVVIDQDVPMVVLTDQRRLVQIILTLLSNAHKHTATGSLTFRIFHPKLGEITQKTRLRFQVEDTGEGMETSVQERLSKLFISGIGYQDFKAISAFGFNLFICNILAKKLFYPDYQFQFNETRDNREFQADGLADPGGIKFTSNFGLGSTFYFDIKLIEERKNDKMMDSIFNYIVKDQTNPLDFSTTNAKNYRHFVQNSVPYHPNNLSQNVAPNENIFPPSLVFAPQQQSPLQPQANHDGTDIPDEEIENEKEKYDSRVMTFQVQPKGLHSDYKFLKCDCKNVLIIDKMQTNLDSMEMYLKNYHLLAHKCRSIQEAIALQTEKSQNKCTICNQETFMCIFVRVDEFYRQNETTFVREFEDFINSVLCKDSILIVIANSESPSLKWLDSLKIDDFLSTTFDSIELQNLIDKWKLLPLFSDSYINQQISISKITASNQR